MHSDLTIWTVGHSNRSLEAFTDLIGAHGIEAIADVRRFPGSRRYPHFYERSLSEQLPPIGVAYHAFRDLGGRRAPRPDSRNTAWRVAGFRGYADYMETEAFRAALDRLVVLARRKRTAVMCAEALWWRCHRSLIADVLKARGTKVYHIQSATQAPEHPWTAAARIVEGQLTYTASSDGSLFDS